jgi:heat shock protein HslJ
MSEELIFHVHANINEVSIRKKDKIEDRKNANVRIIDEMKYIGYSTCNSIN